MSGELYTPASGAILGAIGTDIRREAYAFDGDARAASARLAILNAPFDDANALPRAQRDIRAFYGEVTAPVMTSLEVTLAGRQDRYTGFGNTFNPKLSFRFPPIAQLLLRGFVQQRFSRAVVQPVVQRRHRVAVRRPGARP